MSDIGHNLPPDMTITAGEVSNDLSGWMAENPVILTEEAAREAKLYIDRAFLCVKDLEDERMSKTAPLDEQVKTINDHYRAPRELLKGVRDELKRRFDTFLFREEEKRVLAATETARFAEQAEQDARAAEDRERQAIDEADAGVTGLDIAARTAEADQAFDSFRKASWKAQIAKRETKVRIGGGFRRSLSLKTKTSLVVVDPIAAFTEIGLNNEGINDAICTAARAYKRLSGRWPDGIKIATERKS